MDFFAHQERARKRTAVLVFFFGLSVALMCLGIYAALAVLFDYEHVSTESFAWLWRPRLFAWTVGGVGLVVFGGSLYKTMELRRGGSAVAIRLGGRPIPPGSTDPDELRLTNVVEEMAIAAGTPVPEVYLLKDEPGINAFAAGHTASDAAVAVTRGCLKHLTRDELQGVIAHEFSHILNGDMRLNLRLIGLVHGILCVALIGRILLDVSVRSGRRLGARKSGKDANPLPLIGLVLLVIGYIGVFFGRLIKSAVSRQREFLADAAAVQFTRNPDGLAGALKKIGGAIGGSRLTSPVAEEASHLFFGNALSESWFDVMSTHPPLVRRIQAIEPQFDGRFTPVLLEEPPPPPAPPPTAAPSRRPPLIPSWPGALPVVAGAIAAQVGMPRPEHLRYAAEFKAALPPELVQEARDPLGAVALVYGLLLSDSEDERASQLEALGESVSPPVAAETRRLAPLAATLPSARKLVLIDLALPALRRLSPAQYDEFKTAVRELVESDQQIDLFEYTLQKIVGRHLEPHFHPARPPVVQYYAMKPLLGDCGVLLSVLARVGQQEPARREDAFRLGAQTFGNEAELVYGDAGAESLPQLDAALDRLVLALPPLKRRILNACALTVAADGVVEEREAELLRAIADTLDCPLPPLLQPESVA